MLEISDLAFSGCFIGKLFSSYQSGVQSRTNVLRITVCGSVIVMALTSGNGTFI